MSSGLQETLSVFVSRGLQDTEDGEGRTPLMWAAARGALASINVLGGHLEDADGSCSNGAISNVCNLEKQDKLGYTALHIAGNL